MTQHSPIRIALLPLDDRPVNVSLPGDVARIAGVELSVPPATALPNYRTAGDTAALASWLEQQAADPATKQLLVSTDMLLYGGLIASRTSGDSTRDALARLDLLRDLKSAHPDLSISAVSLVMRASNSYSNAEEPTYWADYGVELHALGGDVQRRLDGAEIEPLDSITPVPADVVSDFSSRRLRNHIANLQVLALVEDGTLDFLAITADDTATFSAGSAEQQWLRHWMRMLPAGREILMYPGADEVGAALVARSLAALSGVQPTFEVVCANPGGMDLVPPYENQPLAASVARQIGAVGATTVDADADVVLVVHGPDPARHDMFRGAPATTDEQAADETYRAVRDNLERGRRVALADVRFPNGADAALVRRLAADDLLSRLEAFGGWNTAGNTLGSVIALAAAGVIGRATGRFDADAAHDALARRILDDYAYQSVIRSEDREDLFHGTIYPIADRAVVESAESAIAGRMNVLLGDLLPDTARRVGRVGLPWRRSFEVDIELSSRA